MWDIQGKKSLIEFSFRHLETNEFDTLKFNARKTNKNIKVYAFIMPMHYQKTNLSNGIVKCNLTRQVASSLRALSASDNDDEWAWNRKCKWKWSGALKRDEKWFSENLLFTWTSRRLLKFLLRLHRNQKRIRFILRR